MSDTPISTAITLDASETETGPPEQRWVTFQRLAEELGVSRHSIYRAHRAGRLVTVEVMPGLVRVDANRLPAGVQSRDG